MNDKQDSSDNLISVIVPVYNVEAYLRRCVDSILAQSFQDYELILVDDGSKDASGKICDEYLEKDSRIKVFHKSNGGLSDARNYGLDRISGDFVTFIDSDDWVDRDYLESLYDMLISTSSDVCQGNFRFAYDDKNERLAASNSQNVTLLSKPEAIHSLYKFNWNGIYIPVWGKLYKSCLFNNVRFKKGRIHEDNFMTCDIVVRGDYERIAILQEAKYNYYQRQGGLATEWKNPKEVNDKFAAHLYLIEAISRESQEYSMFWRSIIRVDVFRVLKYLHDNPSSLPKEFYTTLKCILHHVSSGEMIEYLKPSRWIHKCFLLAMRWNVCMGIMLWRFYYTCIRFGH